MWEILITSFKNQATANLSKKLKLFQKTEQEELKAMQSKPSGIMAPTYLRKLYS